MKELGEYLKETREANAVGLDEASDDLKIDRFDLENIEEGNVRAFKDVLSMKTKIKDYAKYLGLDSEEVIDEFNDFLFEHTSKISLEDILAAEKKKKKEEVEVKIYSPYTKITVKKINKKPILIAGLSILIVFLLILIAIFVVRPKDEINSRELHDKMIGSGIIEFTK